MQGSNGNADIVNRLEDKMGEGLDGINWEKSKELVHSLPYVK